MTDSRRVVDASVVVKWFIPEVGAASALEALRMVRNLGVGSIRLHPVAERATQPLEIALSTDLSVYDSGK